MVEQIRINPEEVRGYGNVCEEHSLEDFIVSSSALAKEKETVHGALTDVYKLVYSLYGFVFDFDTGNKQLYLQMGEANILSFGFDDDSKQLYLLDMAGTGLSLGFDEDTNELYISDAPPIVHNYSLALDSESYTTTGSLSVSATLLDDGVAVSGATVSFTGGTSTVTATTNDSGVATATVNFTSSGTLTASYSTVSDTATVTVSSIIWEDDFNRSSLGSNWITYGTNGNASISNNQLVLSRSGDGRRGIYYNQYITGNYKVTIELASGNYDTHAIGLQTSGTGWTMYEVQPKWCINFSTVTSSGSVSSVHDDRTSGVSYTSATIVIEVIKDTSISLYIDGTLKKTYAVQDRTTDGYIGTAQCCNRSTTINSIKVEAL